METVLFFYKFELTSCETVGEYCGQFQIWNGVGRIDSLAVRTIEIEDPDYAFEIIYGPKKVVWPTEYLDQAGLKQLAEQCDPMAVLASVVFCYIRNVFNSDALDKLRSGQCVVEGNGDFTLDSPSGIALQTLFVKDVN